MDYQLPTEGSGHLREEGPVILPQELSSLFRPLRGFAVYECKCEEQTEMECCSYHFQCTQSPENFDVRPNEKRCIIFCVSFVVTCTIMVELYFRLLIRHIFVDSKLQCIGETSKECNFWTSCT